MEHLCFRNEILKGNGTNLQQGLVSKDFTGFYSIKTSVKIRITELTELKKKSETTELQNL